MYLPLIFFFKITEKTINMFFLLDLYLSMAKLVLSYWKAENNSGGSRSISGTTFINHLKEEL